MSTTPILVKGKYLLGIITHMLFLQASSQLNRIHSIHLNHLQQVSERVNYVLIMALILI